LDDAIKIERLKLDGNATPSQSVEQPGPSQKGPPKWLIKTLESVHLDEVGKMGNRSFTRQDGGDVDNSDSDDVDNSVLGVVSDLDVSYDCELNQLPLKKLLPMMSGKKPCRRSMMLSSRMGHGSWWIFHLETNQLDVAGSTRTSTNQMAHLKSIRRGLWKKGMHIKKT
jgi:hypothetical protein